jgi:hypothetical protein
MNASCASLMSSLWKAAADSDSHSRRASAPSGAAASIRVSVRLMPSSALRRRQEQRVARDLLGVRMKPSEVRNQLFGRQPATAVVRK